MTCKLKHTHIHTHRRKNAPMPTMSNCYACRQYPHFNSHEQVFLTPTHNTGADNSRTHRQFWLHKQKWQNSSEVKLVSVINALCIEWKSVIMYNANPCTYQWYAVHDNNEVMIIGYIYALLMLAKKRNKNGGKHVKSWVQSKLNQVVLNVQSMYSWSLTLFTKKKERNWIDS